MKYDYYNIYVILLSIMIINILVILMLIAKHKKLTIIKCIEIVDYYE